MERILFTGDIEQLRVVHAKRRAAIRARLAEFAKVAEERYFYECVYCLLTPQSSAVNAGKAVAELESRNFQTRTIDPEPLLHTTEYYIRFHRTKASHLKAFKEKYPELRAMLAKRPGNGGDDRAVREWIVANITGMGWKEASHFLRNIGRRNLAILDRHILKNLVRAGAIAALPKTLTAKRYLEVEAAFLNFAASTDIAMDELDLLFWSMETGEILK